jgi:hypothetical protein
MAAAVVIAAAIGLTVPASGYPPAVGLLGKSKSCLACHVNNGPWIDEKKTIIDIVDKETQKSLRQPDGTFLIEARRYQPKTVVTVIGRAKDDTAPSPHRNAWLYVDPARVETESMSKFAAGWEVNLCLSCRVVGDRLQGYEGAAITALPMTLRPLGDATDAMLQLQLMLTRGESVKGKPTEGMEGNYFERTVRLRVLD